MGAGDMSRSHVERAVPGTKEWLRLAADHLSRYFYAASFVANRRVLDAGTGPGYGAVILKSAGASEVQAVDIDQATVDDAARRYSSAGVEFIVDDCEKLSRTHGAFDVICNFENIEHLRSPDAFLRQASSRLVSDGVLFCSSPDRESRYSEWVDGRPNNPYHEHEWYSGEFKSLLNKYFHDVQIMRQVEAFSYTQRCEAARHLHAHLVALWRNPFARVGRILQRVVGGRHDWLDVRGFAASGVGDYPIVHDAIANCVGDPWCLYAVCRRPIQ